MAPEPTSFIVPQEAAGLRVDQFLAQHLGGSQSRMRIQQAIRSGGLLINGQPILDPNYRLQAQDQGQFHPLAPKTSTLTPTKGPLDILFEDEDLIVVNKPEGQAVHLGNQIQSGSTLVEAVLSHTPLSTAAGAPRPGVVHRLDQATSGVILFAKSDPAYWGLTQAFAERRIHKTYHALVWGTLTCKSGTLPFPIGRNTRDRTAMCVHFKGRTACTQWECLEPFPTANQTLLACYPITGRTHQIRVHLKHIGHPIVGDSKYGKLDTRLFLHAYQITFTHPVTQHPCTFTATWPPSFQERIEELRHPKSFS